MLHLVLLLWTLTRDAGSMRKQGVSSIVQQNQEFSIQNEDFPALPGFKGTYLTALLKLQNFFKSLKKLISPKVDGIYDF